MISVLAFFVARKEVITRTIEMYLMQRVGQQLCGYPFARDLKPLLCVVLEIFVIGATLAFFVRVQV